MFSLSILGFRSNSEEAEGGRQDRDYDEHDLHGILWKHTGGPDESLGSSDLLVSYTNVIRGG